MNDLLGPLAGLALALLFLTLLYTGKLLPRNTVRREDFDEQHKIIESYAEGLKKITDALTRQTDSLDGLVGLIEMVKEERNK